MLFQFVNSDLLNEIRAVLGFESFISLVDWTIESNRRENGAKGSPIYAFCDEFFTREM